MHDSTSIRRALISAFLASFVALIAVGAGVSPAGAAASTTTVQVEARHPFTRTGVTVKAGDKVTITATGKMYFGGGNLTAVAPTGVPWGPKCTAIVSATLHRQPFPAPGLPCYSLIAGRARARRSRSATRSRSTPRPRVAPARRERQLRARQLRRMDGDRDRRHPGRGEHHELVSSSHTGLFVIIAVVVLLLLLLLFLLRKRSKDRKKRGRGTRTAPEPVAPVVVPPVAAAPVVEEMPAPVEEEVIAPLDPLQPFAAPDPDSIDVNIYEVEFNNGLVLRVGYNHFPEGTKLRFRVSQKRCRSRPASS